MNGVLLINSDRLAIMERMDRFAEVDVSLITADRYASLYAKTERVRSVTSISNLDEVLKAALELARQHPFHSVIAATEKSVLPAAYVRAILALDGQKVDQALTFTHKFAMKRALHEAGVPVAKWALCSRIADVASVASTLGWPIVLKPVAGSGGKHTIGISSDQEFVEALRDGRIAELGASGQPIQVERQLVVANEYHCDSVVRGGRIEFASVSRMFAPLLSVDRGSVGGSHRIDKSHTQHDAILRTNQLAIAALGLRDGVTHFECFETSEGIFAGEIACRPGGGGVVDVIALSENVDMWDELIRAELQIESEQSTVASMPPVDVESVVGWTYARSSEVVASEVAQVPGVRSVREGDNPATLIILLEGPTEADVIQVHEAVTELIEQGGRSHE